MKKVFQEYLTQKGLKSTRQREIILDEFLRSPSHLSAEELYLRLRKKHPNIGYATVYRTLKLFAECGIAQEQHFGDKQTRYEAAFEEEHHHHLVCTQCGAIIEFEDPRLDPTYEEIARKHGFFISDHRVDIRGLCSKCQGKG